MIASMFEANAKLPRTMGLVSTLLYFPRTNFIHLHCYTVVIKKGKLQHAAQFTMSNLEWNRQYLMT